MSYSDSGEYRRGAGGRRHAAMVAATLAVALLAVALLLAGARVLGYEIGQDGKAVSGIGVAAEPVIAANDAPGRPAPSGSTSPSGDAMMAEQPAPPQPTTPKPSVSKSASAKATVKVQTGNASKEHQVVELVNVQRAKAGCSAVTIDSRLTSAARGHSSDMATRNYFSHDTKGGGGFADRITKAGYVWSTAGENIAMGQTSAASVMNAWMNSSGHKANILNCNFRNIGVGLAYNSSNRPYWTQDFGTLRS
ncbi:MAG: CAP domain-containing protein [Micromonosporaceae bacterium]|nr:CAP domain-containing protein [Micromonosporaceae bacterium]